jgi:hypothetical protein
VRDDGKRASALDFAADQSLDFVHELLVQQ